MWDSFSGGANLTMCLQLEYFSPLYPTDPDLGFSLFRIKDTVGKSVFVSGNRFFEEEFS